MYIYVIYIYIYICYMCTYTCECIYVCLFVMRLSVCKDLETIGHYYLLLNINIQISLLSLKSEVSTMFLLMEGRLGNRCSPSHLASYMGWFSGLSDLHSKRFYLLNHLTCPHTLKPIMAINSSVKMSSLTQTMSLQGIILVNVLRTDTSQPVLELQVHF